MKKNVLFIIIAGLILVQLLTLINIGSLQRQVANTRTEMSNLGNSLRNEVSGIYANVNEMLKQEASLLETASVELGDFDDATLTVPVTVTVIPKAVGAGTALSLDFDGKQFPMRRDGTAFTATVNRDIFQSAAPLLLIEEGGVTQTIQDDRLHIWGMKEAFLPSLFPRLLGEARYGGGSYHRKGLLFMDEKSTKSGISFVEARLLVEVDGQTVSEDPIPKDRLFSDWEIDKTIPLRDGQTCVMTVVAVSSIGFTHRYPVDHFVGGATAQREPWFNTEQIFSADGDLIWQTEYEQIG